MRSLIRACRVSLARLTFFALMCLGVGLMILASASYVELGSRHPFVLEKLPLAQPRLWLAALYVHVPSALLALPACLLLLVARVRKNWPWFHRWLGRITGFVILVALVPSGLYLALFARGGWVSTLGFWLSGLITALAMAQSITRARSRNFAAHRRASSHVTAQLAVAVLSRLLLVSAERFELGGEWVYGATLWFSVIACAAVAESLTGPRHVSITKGARYENLVAKPILDVVR